MYKKAWCTCIVVVLLIKPIVCFFYFLVTVSLRADPLNLVYIHTICDTWAGCTAG